MNWQRIGRIFTASGQFEWMNSHTACPVAYKIGEKKYRIYFGTRDGLGRPSIGSVVVSLDRPSEILELSCTPHLTQGPRGFFDDNGVYPGPIVSVGEQDLMYYMGRSNGEGGLYYMSIGLARLEPSGDFSRVYRAPVLGRSEYDPWMTSTPCVLKEKGLFRMWYLSGVGWDSSSVSRYHIKYAESVDGVCWDRSGQVAIDFVDNETNIASPAVWKEGSKYRMIFCVSSSASESAKGYGLEFAESDDGYAWVRRGPLLIEGGEESSWDSNSRAYPSVFRDGDNLYLLYSGNFNGRLGFGIAINKKDAKLE